MKESRDDTNEVFNLALKLVRESARNVFLTGRAGTGKTTFLRHIRDTITKQTVVVAPTGVAAINAGGVTIHSFFQLPISPYIPESNPHEDREDASNKHSLLSRLRFTTDRKKLLQQLELLVIDEISMVRCDTLDAIDTVLRHVRQRPLDAFGGVQVLFIGDMFQLPPVVPNIEWNILSQFYSSPYFFDSRVLKEQQPLYIEFNKIYRQSDSRFIHALNQVRNNELDKEGMEILDSRFDPNFHRGQDAAYIVLTTHNAKADDINGIELKKLKTPSHSFKADINGDFPDKAFPADQSLEIKIGAQVMFIKNDPEKGKRYYNGKIGEVVTVEKEKVVIICNDNGGPIEVSRHEWKNIRYSLNSTSSKIEEEELGSFKQFPLRLAWAITIHKSQGLTFEKAIIDTGDAFAPGQVYVALSRCTTLEGLVLKSKIRSHGLFMDKRLIEFARNAANTEQLQRELEASTDNYKQQLLATVFDFGQPLSELAASYDYVEKNNTSFNKEALQVIELLKEQLASLHDVTRKFNIQIRSMFADTSTPVAFIQQRIDAAARYFEPGISRLQKSIVRVNMNTKSKLHAKQVNDHLKEVFRGLCLQLHLMKGSTPRFSIEGFQEARNSFVLPSFFVNVYQSGPADTADISHPVLYHQLKRLRDSICQERNQQVFMVANSKSLEELATYLPQTTNEMLKITGFGEARVKAYGQQFLDLIVGYCAAEQLTSKMDEHPAAKTKSATKAHKDAKIAKTSKAKSGKPDTKQASLDLLRQGKTIRQIANDRKLTPQTIENHLAHFIEIGELTAEVVVDEQKLARINHVIKDYNGGSITPVKDELGDDISFGEIRFAFAHKRYLEKQR